MERGALERGRMECGSVGCGSVGLWEQRPDEVNGPKGLGRIAQALAWVIVF